jgi:hypothetical protein
MGSAFAAVITNISNRGCRIRTSETLVVGEVIVLDLPRLGTLSAEVRWSKLGSVGLCFIMGTEAWRPSPREAQREALRQHGCGTVL